MVVFVSLNAHGALVQASRLPTCLVQFLAPVATNIGKARLSPLPLAAFLRVHMRLRLSCSYILRVTIGAG